MMKNLSYNHVLGLQVLSSSAAFSFESATKRILFHHAVGDQHYDASAFAPDETSRSRGTKRDSAISRMNKIGERMDNFAQGIREHVKLGPKLTDTLKGKLSLGVRILQVGGVEKVFEKNFSVKQEEKLVKVSQCYLSTTSGPIAGLLFISTHKVAFCSEKSIKVLSPSGDFLRIRSKVVIPLQKRNRANASENVKMPSQKYIQIVTEDNFEFRFMGFLNHQNTLRCLQLAISGSQ